MKGVRDIHGDKNEAFASIPMTLTLYDEIENQSWSGDCQAESSEASFCSIVGDVGDGSLSS